MWRVVGIWLTNGPYSTSEEAELLLHDHVDWRWKAYGLRATGGRFSYLLMDGLDQHSSSFEGSFKLYMGLFCIISISAWLSFEYNLCVVKRVIGVVIQHNRHMPWGTVQRREGAR